MQPAALNDHSSMGSSTFPQQLLFEDEDSSGNRSVSWYSNPMQLPTISTPPQTSREMYLMSNPFNVQPVTVNTMTSPYGQLNYTEIRNNMDQEIAKQECNQSNNFIVNHLKIHEYIKSLNDTIGKWNIESNLNPSDSEKETSSKEEVNEEEKLNEEENSTTDFTDLVIENLSKIDFNKVGHHMKKTLEGYQTEIDTLLQKYKRQSTLLESLDSYNNKIMMDLISVQVDTTDQFSQMLSEHINNIISQDIVRDTQMELLVKIKEFLNVYERFKFVKHIDETTGQCGLCMDRPVDITFLPCYHCCCSHCHSLFQLSNKCPMCRSVISSHHKIFI